jgi:hypothetical protein
VSSNRGESTYKGRVVLESVDERRSKYEPKAQLGYQISCKQIKRRRGDIHHFIIQVHSKVKREISKTSMNSFEESKT